MSRSILVVDTPESCIKCPLIKPISTFTCQGFSCSRNNKKIDCILHRSDWCPLRDMPERASHPDYCDNGRYDKGWNDCIDEILKGRMEWRKGRMNGDLINRKALLGSMDKRYKEKCSVVQDNLAEGFMQMEKLIKEQPTAYDVDKVVERMEEIREEILSDTAYDNETVNHYLEYTDLMIEFVKSGFERK